MMRSNFSDPPGYLMTPQIRCWGKRRPSSERVVGDSYGGRRVHTILRLPRDTAKAAESGSASRLKGGISIPFWESDRVCLILGLFANYRSASETRGESFSETEGPSTTDGTSQTFTEGRSTSHGTGSPESIHHCPLVQPGQVGRVFARIDDRRDPAYLGLALVMVAARA